jgi:Uma2 family endonuclease
MTALLTPPTAPPRLPPPGAPRPYRWTNDDFRRLTDDGYFTDRFVILIDGEFIEMPHPGPPHDMAVSLTLPILQAAFAPGHFVRVQTGFVTGLDTNPGPDLCVVPGSPRDYTTHPRVAVLVVEVSDTSLAMDTGAKFHIYAAAGVPEYWVIDVNDPRLLVYRDPVADASAPRGHRYGTTLTLTPADTVTPVAAPNAFIRVADLLP